MIFPKDLKRYYECAEDFLRDKEILPGKSGRHMKFPYTLSAKIAQFPLFFYMKNNWLWMYYPLGALAGLWFFNKIHKVVNSESNKRSWAESQMKSAAKERHH